MTGNYFAESFFLKGLTVNTRVTRSSKPKKKLSFLRTGNFLSSLNQLLSYLFFYNTVPGL